MKLFCRNWHIVMKAHMLLNIIFTTKFDIATFRAWCKGGKLLKMWNLPNII
jgi:hypothetical protein